MARLVLVLGLLVLGVLRLLVVLVVLQAALRRGAWYAVEDAAGGQLGKGSADVGQPGVLPSHRLHKVLLLVLRCLCLLLLVLLRTQLRCWRVRGLLRGSARWLPLLLLLLLLRGRGHLEGQGHARNGGRVLHPAAVCSSQGLLRRIWHVRSLCIGGCRLLQPPHGGDNKVNKQLSTAHPHPLKSEHKDNKRYITWWQAAAARAASVLSSPAAGGAGLCCAADSASLGCGLVQAVAGTICSSRWSMAWRSWSSCMHHAFRCCECLLTLKVNTTDHPL
jgi:hypothetical protein